MASIFAQLSVQVAYWESHLCKYKIKKLKKWINKIFWSNRQSSLSQPFWITNVYLLRKMISIFIVLTFYILNSLLSTAVIDTQLQYCNEIIFTLFVKLSLINIQSFLTYYFYIIHLFFPSNMRRKTQVSSKCGMAFKKNPSYYHYALIYKISMKGCHWIFSFSFHSNNFHPHSVLLSHRWYQDLFCFFVTQASMHACGVGWYPIFCSVPPAPSPVSKLQT